MLGLLREAGHTVVSDIDDAEGVLINTCGFITDAAQEGVDTILHYADLKDKGHIKTLVVAGCLVQRYGSDITEEIPQIDVLMGTGDYGRIVEAFARAEAGEHTSFIGEPGWLAPEGAARVISTPRHYAYIKVSEGCSNRCSYCMIPSLRGPQKSRPIEAIVQEARRLAEYGVVEAILVAQDTTAYGRDLYGKPGLAHLLREVCRVDGLEWIRVLYTYPSLIDDRLIEVLATEHKILPYLDIPMQHGSDAILKAMRRRIDRQAMIDVCSKLRQAIPDLVIRTSLIVGFPGERDCDFDDLLSFIREVKPQRAGVFMFSAEEGAHAAGLPDQVDATVAAERRGLAMEALATISHEFGQGRVGSVQRVLIDGPSEESELVCVGRSYAEAPDVDGVVYVGDASLEAGRFVDVRITDANDYDIAGEPLEDPIG